MPPFNPDPGNYGLRRCASVSAIHSALEPAVKGPFKSYSLKKYPSCQNLSEVVRKRNEGVMSARDKSSHYHYSRDNKLHDDFWWEQRHNISPLHWPFIRSPSRRYNYIDPPHGLLGHYPGLWANPSRSRYLTEQTHLDGLYWNRYRDPGYSRPWWQPQRYQLADVPRCLNMYRQNLIGFHDIDRHWLRPSHYRRRTFDQTHGFGYSGY